MKCDKNNHFHKYYCEIESSIYWYVEDLMIILIECVIKTIIIPYSEFIDLLSV